MLQRQDTGWINKIFYCLYRRRKFPLVVIFGPSWVWVMNVYKEFNVHFKENLYFLKIIFRRCSWMIRQYCTFIKKIFESGKNSAREKILVIQKIYSIFFYDPSLAMNQINHIYNCNFFSRNLGLNEITLYSMSKKYWPILYSNLLHKMGLYFLDRQYLL